LRVATWNLKLGVAPRAKPEALWAWAEERIDPDVMVFTEAKVPKTGVPDGWSAVWTEGGIGKHRRWGTVIAGRGVELREVEWIDDPAGRIRLESSWPAAVKVVDVFRDGELRATVVGIYGLTTDLEGARVGHGGYTVPEIMFELDPLFESDRRGSIIVAGDFNLHPQDIPFEFSRAALVDLIEATSHQRDSLVGCSGCGVGDNCGHMFTHRNGTSPNAAVQQIDYIFAGHRLARQVGRVWGGLADFPDVWDMSDHAPVVAEFG